MPGQADEQLRPDEWLHALEEGGAYPRLFEESGSLAFAAWRLCRARRRARGAGGLTPNRAELYAAAVEIAERMGWHDPMPAEEALATECAFGGLPVLDVSPEPRRAA